jgi:hypothetical protein
VRPVAIAATATTPIKGKKTDLHLKPPYRYDLMLARRFNGSLDRQSRSRRTLSGRSKTGRRQSPSYGKGV